MKSRRALTGDSKGAPPYAHSEANPQITPRPGRPPPGSGPGGGRVTKLKRLYDISQSRRKKKAAAHDRDRFVRNASSYMCDFQQLL
jgi:hypothetical protein